MADPSARLFSGVCIEARATLLHSLAIEPRGSTKVALVADPRRAAELAAEIRTNADWNESELEVLHFPEDPPPDIDGGRRMDRICERLSVLSALLSPGRRLIVTTPEALLGPCLERAVFESRQIQLEIGQHTDYAALQQKLIQELDYDSEALCEHPGQIAVRGGLLDIYPFDATRPYRIDFFGDEIESIRILDPTSQRSEEAVSHITVPAASSATEKGAKEGAFSTYLPEKDIGWILEEPSMLVREHPYRFEKIKSSNSLRTVYQLFEQRAKAKDHLDCICELDTDHELFTGAERISLSTEATENYRFHSDAGQVGQDRFESEQSTRLKFEIQLNDWAKEELSLCFVTAGDSETKRIKELLADNPLTEQLEPTFLNGTISGGFIYRSFKDFHLHSPVPRSLQAKEDHSKTKQGFVLVTDTEFFGRRQRRISGKRERARPTISQVDQLLDFTELADSDALVHLQHGVCLFRGLTLLDIQGGAKEVISVEFADEMTIHVPLHESHLLTRYVGLNKAQPKLGKIGGSSWEKTRSAAERSTLDYAAELLHLHARREQ